MAQITIILEENSWKEFQKQSIDLNRTNSERIQEFINNELKKDLKVKQ